LCLGIEPEALAEQIGDGGSITLKAVTAEAVNEFLAPLRARRRAFAADVELASKILRTGNEVANEAAEATLAEVRQAMGTIY
jgi:tryptophanyl-tRNA synthetase